MNVTGEGFKQTLVHLHLPRNPLWFRIHVCITVLFVRRRFRLNVPSNRSIIMYILSLLKHIQAHTHTHTLTYMINITSGTNIILS